MNQKQGEHPLFLLNSFFLSMQPGGRVYLNVIKTLSASMSVAYPPQGRIHRNYGKNYGKNYGEIHVKSGENHIDLIWTCGVYGKGYKKGFCPPVTYQPERTKGKNQGKHQGRNHGSTPSN